MNNSLESLVTSPFFFVVEDDPDLREVISFRLRKLLWGIRVASFSSKKEAELAFMQLNEISLPVIGGLIDCNLEDGSGLDLAQEMKESSRGFEPVIILTSGCFPQGISFAAASGNFLWKSRDLVKRLELLLPPLLLQNFKGKRHLSPLFGTVLDCANAHLKIA